jgi:transcriptional regulator with XRE-family HTH domain
MHVVKISGGTFTRLSVRDHFTVVSRTGLQSHGSEIAATRAIDTPSTALRMGSRTVLDTTEMAEESFGRRLRSERERRRITLELIAANTKIGVGLLKGLERDDFSRWPCGLFRRSFMRSYAIAIGLDAEETVREFLERFPDPQAAIAADTAATGKGSSNPGNALRLTLADPRPPFSGGRILSRASRRLAAAGCDAAMTVTLALTAFVLIDEFWAPLGVAMLCYYTGSVLVLGNTPGVCLFAPQSSDDSRWLRPGGSDPGDTEGNDALNDLAPETAFGRGFAG